MQSAVIKRFSFFRVTIGLQKEKKEMRNWEWEIKEKNDEIYSERKY